MKRNRKLWSKVLIYGSVHGLLYMAAVVVAMGNGDKDFWKHGCLKTGKN